MLPAACLPKESAAARQSSRLSSASPERYARQAAISLSIERADGAPSVRRFSTQVLRLMAS